MQNLDKLLGVYADAGIFSYIENNQLKIRTVPELEDFYQTVSQNFPKYFTIEQLYDIPYLTISKVCKAFEVAAFDEDFDEVYIKIINSFEQDKGLDMLCDLYVKQYQGQFEKLFATINKITSTADPDKPVLIYKNRTIHQSNANLSRYLVEILNKPILVAYFLL